MDKKKIIDWIDDIVNEDGFSLSAESMKTLGLMQREIVQEATNGRMASCGWKHQGEEYDYYETECDNAFELTNGTPKENGMIYCPYCGKKIKESGADV